ncbi:TRF2-interacting telomeric protein/Rap1 C-terminal domain-containing protein [Entamoeba marina]
MDDDTNMFETGFITPTPSPTPDILMDPYLRSVRDIPDCYSPYEAHVNSMNRPASDKDRMLYINKIVNEIKGQYGVDERVVIYALYACSGDVELTKKFFSEGKVSPWTSEEDQILVSNDVEKILKIICSRGKQETEKRCHFLSCNGGVAELTQSKY